MLRLHVRSLCLNMYYTEYTERGTPMLNWDSRYLCHLSTEMAEIWSPGTSFQDVRTYTISAIYLFFLSYKSFCGVFSDFRAEILYV